MGECICVCVRVRMYVCVSVYACACVRTLQNTVHMYVTTSSVVYTYLIRHDYEFKVKEVIRVREIQLARLR